MNDGLHTFAQAGQLQHGIQAVARLVEDVNVEPVGAFVGKADLNGAERSFQRMPDGFWPAPAASMIPQPAPGTRSCSVQTKAP